MDIKGGEIMIIGDLHFSDVFHGRHKDYLSECFWVLGRLTELIEERRPSGVVLLGDIVGWQETNIRNRQVMSMFFKVFRRWNAVCQVFSLRGNHDMRGYPDFNILEEFGLITTSAGCGGYIDYYGYDGQELPEARLHLVDYGDEHRQLDILSGTSNIVLAHADFRIDGVTPWYPEPGAIELGTHMPFSDVDMVVIGHIHAPSPDMYEVTMPSGKSCSLFVPGCPMRVQWDSSMWESVWTVHIRYNGTDTSVDTLPFALQPIDEVFESKESFIEEDSAEEVERKAALKDVLDDLLKYRMTGGSPIDQVQMIPGASQAAKDMAVSYLNIAFGGVGR